MTTCDEDTSELHHLFTPPIYQNNSGVHLFVDQTTYISLGCLFRLNFALITLSGLKKKLGEGRGKTF